jgi:soluble lytic murein transglycosylase-like protein
MDRLRAFEASTGLEQGAHLAFLRTLLAPIAARTLTDGSGAMTMYPARVSLMDRMIRARSAADADFIRDEIQRAAADINGGEIARRLDLLVPCP